MKRAADVYLSAECYRCLHAMPGTTGVVFDVRLPNDHLDVNKLLCPRCGIVCEVSGRWSADESGFHGVIGAIRVWWRDRGSR
jgi:hypothetical protein